MATCASVLPEQYQSRSWPPSPQPRRSYSRDRDLGVRRLVATLDLAERAGGSGSCQQTFGFVSSGWSVVAQRPAVQRAALAAGEAGTVQEDAAAVDARRSCGRPRRRSRSRRSSCVADVVELPVVSGEQLDELLDALLVRLVGEVGAERAAAVVRPVGVDALAAGAEDARPARGQPSEVALVALGLVARGRRTRPRHGGSRGKLQARRQPMR